jgi:YopX protein
MNREIKFRAWNTAIKDWLLPRDNWWVSPNGEPYIYGITKNMIPSPPEQTILMQFTGLKDKYEGDILEGAENEVRWDDQAAHYDFGLLVAQLASMNVIGNIYENSDLLK